MSRDSWCTPKELADALGVFDLDPCSNERSHIRAAVELDGRNEAHDGLLFEPRPAWRIFVNPPYSRGQVIRWVEKYRAFDTTFLLRWDPSTEWFRELMPYVTEILFPLGRVEFEPPPGVDASSNPFPHALYFTRAAPPGFKMSGHWFRFDGRT